MLFCTQAKTTSLVPPTGIAGPTASGAISPDGAYRPKTAHNGKIRLGGGCRMPLQGEPMERDRPRRSARAEVE
jgi:hypothetical protein